MMSKRFQFLPDANNTSIHKLAKNHMKLLTRTPRINKAYYFYSISWIKIQTRTENMNLTKLIVLVTRIPKHLDLHFSDFSTNF